VDGLEKKIASMTEELTSMQNQIREMQEDTLVNNAKKALAEAQGRAALYRVTEFAGIKKRLLNVRTAVKDAIVSTDRDIARTALLAKGQRIGKRIEMKLLLNDSRKTIN